MKAILSVLPVELLPAKTFNIPEVEETGETFIENALLKARHASHFSNYPAIADDSGLVVEHLNGVPGIYSARYAGFDATNEERIDKLLQALKGVPDDKRTAYFYSAVVFVRHAKDPIPIIGQGVWKGKILTKPVGTHGLGYDPVFYVHTHHCSAAELKPEIKNQLSHRYCAITQLVSQLKVLFVC